MPKGKAASPTRGPRNGGPNSRASLGFEATLWAAAGKLRGHMNTAKYKRVVLALVFLKYISDAFEERHARLLKAATDSQSAYYVKDETTWELCKMNLAIRSSDSQIAHGDTFHNDRYRFLEGRAAGSVLSRIRLCRRPDAYALISAPLPTERVHLSTALSGLPPA